MLKLIVTGILAFLCAFWLGSTYYYHSPFYPAIVRASAVIHSTKGNTITGVVYFEQKSDGLHITADIEGLTPGLHGIHIHEYGDCACDDAICTGEHFNPTNQPHGGLSSAQRHVGDFGNLEANSQGIAHLAIVDKLTTLNGPHSILGRALIVHAQPDDLVSQPSGNSGARIGCGVVGIRK